jgi:hypothetical protein
MEHQEKQALIVGYQINPDIAAKANEFNQSLELVNSLIPDGDEKIDWANLLTGDTTREMPFVKFACWATSYIDTKNPKAGNSGIFSKVFLEEELGNQGLETMIEKEYLEVISKNQMDIRSTFINNLYKIFPPHFFNPDNIIMDYMQMVDESYNAPGQQGKAIHEVIHLVNSNFHDKEDKYEIITRTLELFNLAKEPIG